MTAEEACKLSYQKALERVISIIERVAEDQHNSLLVDDRHSDLVANSLKQNGIIEELHRLGFEVKKETYNWEDIRYVMERREKKIWGFFKKEEWFEVTKSVPRTNTRYTISWCCEGVSK